MQGKLEMIFDILGGDPHLCQPNYLVMELFRVIEGATTCSGVTNSRFRVILNLIPEGGGELYPTHSHG